MDESLGRDLEEKLLNKLFSVKLWKPIVQKRLLRLATLILENIRKEKMDTSKKIVVLDIWKKIKSDDHGLKAWAFLALAKFANKIPMPNERIQEVIYYFLGENIGEFREIINEGIDNMVPVMYIHTVPQHDQNLYLIEKAIRINSASLNCLHNIFGMVVRNQEVFRQYKSLLYPRMIQAFQKIFFYAKPLLSKILAFELTKVMLTWSKNKNEEPKVRETELQIKEIVASCLYKELFQLHYILECDEVSDKDCMELTYKCLVMLRSILVNSPTQHFKFSNWERPHQINYIRDQYIQITTLNVIYIIMKYYNRDQITDELIRRFVEGAQSCLYCRWIRKLDFSSPQKQPHIIEGTL